MTKEKTTSQSPEEMAKAAQEAAVKAAMEQAQSLSLIHISEPTRRS